MNNSFGNSTVILSEENARYFPNCRQLRLPSDSFNLNESSGYNNFLNSSFIHSTPNFNSSQEGLCSNLIFPGKQKLRLVPFAVASTARLNADELNGTKYFKQSRTSFRSGINNNSSLNCYLNTSSRNHSNNLENGDGFYLYSIYSEPVESFTRKFQVCIILQYWTLGLGHF